MFGDTHISLPLQHSEEGSPRAKNQPHSSTQIV